VVKTGELGSQLGADFVSLQGTAGCEDGDFGHRGAQIDNACLAFEFAGGLDVLVDFFFDQRDVGFEGGLAESKFDELG
jgi:hypothetical protein